MFEVRRIDGKRFIEYNLALSLIWIGIIIFAVGFLLLTFFLYVQSDRIYSDPLNYAMQKYGISYAEGLLDSGHKIFFNKTAIKITQKGGSEFTSEINFSEFSKVLNQSIIK